MQISAYRLHLLHEICLTCQRAVQKHLSSALSEISERFEPHKGHTRLHTPQPINSEPITQKQAHNNNNTKKKKSNTRSQQSCGLHFPFSIYFFPLIFCLSLSLSLFLCLCNFISHNSIYTRTLCSNPRGVGSWDRCDPMPYPLGTCDDFRPIWQ